MNHESRREIEEMRIVKTMEATCRKCDIVLRMNFDVPQDDVQGRTSAKVDFFHGNRERYMQNASNALLIFGLATAILSEYRPHLWLIWTSSIASFLGIAAVLLKVRMRRVTHAELIARIDRDLIAAGFIVENTATTWRVTFPCDGNDTDGDEWKAPRGTPGA